MRRPLKAAFALLLLCPALAHAHSAGGALNGWHDGFSHPWHGWDHLVVMIAVGWWAAQQRGRAIWLIPLTFVAVMTLGGVVGASGLVVPGVELAILASVVVFSVLVARRIRIRLALSIALVGFFAFFHGFAHGAEMPGSASMAAFGLGFVLATLLLHACGLVTGRLFASVLAVLLGSSTLAQQAPSPPTSGSAPNPDGEAVRLPELVVSGRQDSMIGIALSATQGTVGGQELADRPILRTGEILETVPGVIITQHAGGGKANQYFLRGFNLDHGTDLAIDLDGMPLNLPSHAHGPGYSDMNIVIPELVQRVNFEKGPYYLENGDFSSAGAVHLEFAKTLPQPMAVATTGMYGYQRLFVANSSALGRGNLLYGFEAYHDDGPWVKPDDYRRFNGILTYSGGDTERGFTVTARGYHGQWNSSDQIAESAVGSGAIPFYGSLDPTDGGNSQRYSLQAEWHHNEGNTSTRLVAYAFYYDLDLFSDFTYYLVDTRKGDQFEQADRRWVAGTTASRTTSGQWQGHESENSFGLQLRTDWITNGLYQTEGRARTAKTENNPRDPDVLADPSLLGTVLPAITRQDDIIETTAGLYFENKTQWTDKVRSVAGLRGDVFVFDVTDLNPLNSGRRESGAASPKLNVVFGPWSQTELYLSGGFGFHSDDARGTTARLNPDGSATTPLGGLYQTKGAEFGVRTLALPHLQSTVSFWYLHSDSELLFEGDTGETINTPQPSNRYGVEFANYFTPAHWLTLDLDYADSAANFTEPDSDGGTRVPEAIRRVLAAGATVRGPHGSSATLRLRYFGPRDLISTGADQSKATLLLNLGLGCRLTRHWTVRADVFNLLNRRDHDIDYYYTSQISPQAAPRAEIHFHPVEPIQGRLTFSAGF